MMNDKLRWLDNQVKMPSFEEWKTAYLQEFRAAYGVEHDMKNDLEEDELEEIYEDFLENRNKPDTCGYVAAFNLCNGKAPKPNIIFVGDPDADDVDSFLPLENLVVIQCANADQVRQITLMGKAEFTIFGDNP